MSPTATYTALNLTAIRDQFPILHQQINGKPLVYLDNAASNQKPQRVINKLVEYYSGYHANIHRGIHTLAEKATAAFEETRRKAQLFVNAKEAEEIIFTKGTTEGINLVAHGFGRKFLKPGDEVLITGMEHHSNIVPWQMVCEEKGARLRVIPVSDRGELVMAELDGLLTEKTKLVAAVYVSNSLGTVNPIKALIKRAHEVGATVLVDAAQAASHLPLDVQALDVDFMAFSGHKMYGPTGVGILYGKRELLEAMNPYQSGGEMIREVSFAGTTYNDIPYKFEAGTPNIADVVALGEAFDFLSDLGKDQIAAHEDELLRYAASELTQIDGLRLIGTAPDKIGVASFVIDGIHHFDIGQMLDTRGVAVRTGHHCTQPLMEHFCVEGTVRASFAVYNTHAEVDALIEGLKRTVAVLKP